MCTGNFSFTIAVLFPKIIGLPHAGKFSTWLHCVQAKFLERKIARIFRVFNFWHSPPQRLSHSTGENHVKRGKRSLWNKMCGSRHKSRGSWHVQQQQRFRLEKVILCSDAHGRFYHGAKRSSRAGSCSGFRDVSHRTGTIKY